MRHPLTRRPRRGFTLVELLVACALTVLIMAVLATAFQTGLATFSHLKSTVGLSEQLRSAESVMRRDLEATHLEDADGVPVRISSLGATPPARGYLEVIQATALVLALLIVTLNTVVDLVVLWLDPRPRRQEAPA